MFCDHQACSKMVQLIVDYYALYLKLQNYHWNVEGPNFASLHAFFEEQYTDVALAVDTAAELIRGLGCRVPVMKDIYNQSHVKPALDQCDAQKMVKDLVESYEQVEPSLMAVLKDAQEKGDEVTIDFITSRLTVHRKVLWMLRSHITS